VKLAAGDIRTTMKSFKEQGQIPFMQQKQGKRTQNMYEEIKSSAMATKLLEEGYSVALAHRVAKLEKEKFADQGMTSEALAAKLAEEGQAQP
jgi:hypothetical protein